MGCFNVPKGQRKYKGTQKVEIIERMRSEQMSFYEASSVYGISIPVLLQYRYGKTA